MASVYRHVCGASQGCLPEIRRSETTAKSPIGSAVSLDVLLRGRAKFIRLASAFAVDPETKVTFVERDLSCFPDIVFVRFPESPAEMTAWMLGRG